MAPAFELPNQLGELVDLASFRGRWVVLFFYPKDDTPGCTKEACAFRDALPRFDGVDAVVLGVSPDEAASHQKFIAKYDLPFALLSDSSHKVAEQYGAWGKKNRYGREFEGVIRSTFVIAPDGTLAKCFYNVRVDGHDAKVLAAIDAARAA